MKRCTRCIMPETIEGISFDKNGVCSICSSYIKFKCLGEAELRNVVDESLNREKNKYDCIVPLSGGRDSSYVLYYAKAILGLNVLAVNYDNEFRVDQALINMKKACKILGVEFQTYRSKIDIGHKIVKNNIRRSIKNGPYGISKSICSACSYGYRSVVYRTAAKQDVPLIFWGESPNEATQIIQKLVTRQFHSKLKRRPFDINTYSTRLFKILQRIEFNVQGNSIFKPAPVELITPGIKEIRLFEYIPWDRNTIKKTITEELGWEKPKGNVSSWRIDCHLHSLMNFCYTKMLSLH